MESAKGIMWLIEVWPNTKTNPTKRFELLVEPPNPVDFLELKEASSDILIELLQNKNADTKNISTRTTLIK